MPASSGKARFDVVLYPTSSSTPVTTPSIVTVWPASGEKSPAPWMALIFVTVVGGSGVLPQFCGLLGVRTAKSAVLTSVSCVSPARSYERFRLKADVPPSDARPAPSRHE